MNSTSLARRDSVAHWPAIAVLMTLLVVSAAVLAGGGPAAAAGGGGGGGGGGGQSILTLRTDGDRDGLWLAPADGGAATAAGTLPGIAGSAAVSPDGTTVAYLGSQGQPSVWIGHGPLAPKTIPLQTAGIKWAGSFTWIAADTLLVSGTRQANDFNGYSDRLYTVNVTTGAVAAFRGLTGTQPSADIASGKLVYVRYRKLDNGGPRNGHTPKYRESLMLTTLGGTGAGTALDYQEYRPMADYRAFNSPLIAPGGAWLIAGQTGSDVSVRYSVYAVADRYIEPWLTMPEGTISAAAWAPAGTSVAFAGDVTGAAESGVTPCVYVADPASGALARTSFGLLSGAAVWMVADLAWSNDGRLMADGLGAQDSTGDTGEMHALLLDASDLSTVRDLGEGHLSVWVK